MDSWQELSEFMDAHEDEIKAVVMENEMLRAAYMSYLMMAPGLLVKAMAGTSAELCANVMGMMGLAFCIGQQDRGEKVLAEWLGVEEDSCSAT